MMKKLLITILITTIALLCCGCCLQHEWVEATCTEPKTCTKCGKTEGDPLGHTWEDATCTKAKTCSVCGETEGIALGHKATPATCTEDSVCSVCGEIVEKAKGHQANPATCTEDAICSVCGKTVEKATGHDWMEATASEPKTCKKCGLTEGEPLGYPTFKWNDPTSFLYGLVVTEFIYDKSSPFGAYGFQALGSYTDSEGLMNIVSNDLADQGFDRLINVIQHTMQYGKHLSKSGMDIYTNESWDTGSTLTAVLYTSGNSTLIGLYSDKEKGITHYFKGTIEK